MSEVPNADAPESTPSLDAQADNVLVSGNQAHLRGGGSWPRFATRAKGAHLWDAEGRRYVDLFLASGGVILGHGAEPVARAVTNKALSGAGMSLRPVEEVELASWLRRMLPWLARWIMVKTGSEAAHLATRIAREYTGRRQILSLGYHGWLPPFSSQEGHDACDLIVGPWRLKELLEIMTERQHELAAIVISPHPAVPSGEFYSRLRIAAQRIGALFIMDEIKTGFRFAWPTLSSEYELEPDVLILGKALANGYPLAALGGREEVFSSVASARIYSSTASEAIALAAARACTTQLAAGGHARYAEVASTTFERIRAILPGDDQVVVVGRPTLARLHFRSAALADHVGAQMVERGVLWHPHDDLLVSTAHAEPGVLDEVVRALASSLASR